MRRVFLIIFLFILFSGCAVAQIPQTKTINWYNIYNDTVGGYNDTFWLSADEYSNLTNSTITFNPITQNSTWTSQADFNAGTLNNVTTDAAGYIELNVSGTDANTLALYHLDDGSGTTADNIEGNATRDITTSNDMWNTSDVRFGTGSVESDENGDTMNTTNWIHNTASGTIEFWFKLDDTFDTGDPSNRHIFFHSTASYDVWFLLDQTNGQGWFALYSGGIQNAKTIGMGSWTIDTWYHVACQWGAAGMEVYVNGYLNATNAYAGAILVDGNIAWAGSAVAGSNLNGVIDEIRISDKRRYTANFTPPTGAFGLYPSSGVYTSEIRDLSTNTTITNMTVGLSLPSGNATVNTSWSQDNVTWSNSTEETFTTNGSNLHDFTDVVARYVRYNLTLQTADVYFTPRVDYVNITYMPADVGIELNGGWVNVSGPLNSTNISAVNISNFTSGTNYVNFTGRPTGAAKTLYDATLEIDYTVPAHTHVSDYYGYIWKNTTGPFSQSTNLTFTFDRVSPYYNVSVLVNGTYKNNTTVTDVFNQTDGNFSVTDGDPIIVYIWGLIGDFELNISVDFRMFSVVTRDENDNSFIAYTARSTETGVSKTMTAGAWAHFNGSEIENIVEGDTFARFNISQVGYNARIYEYYLDSYTNITAYLVGSVSGAYITFQVVDNYNRIITGVDVDVYRYVDGVLVETGHTDDTGSIRFFLDVTTQYRINFTHADYDSLSMLLVPTQTFYTIRLTTPATLTMTYNDIVANLYPSWASFNNTSNAVLELIANSSSCSITLCQVNATYSNNTGTTAYNNSSSTGTCGCHLLISFNLSTAVLGDTVVALAWIQGTDTDGGVVVYTINRTYLVYPSEAGNFTIGGVIDDLRTAFSPLSLMLMSLIFSFMITVAVVTRIPIGAMGAGLVFTIMLGVFTYYELFPFIYLIFVAFCTVGAIMLRGRY